MTDVFSLIFRSFEAQPQKIYTEHQDTTMFEEDLQSLNASIKKF